MYRIENIILLAAAVLASVFYVASGDGEQKVSYSRFFYIMFVFGTFRRGETVVNASHNYTHA